MKILTIKDIARISGVGVSTVSRVLNNRPDVNEETRKKVLEVVKENNYSQNNNARHLKQLSTRYISIIVRGRKSMFLNSINERIQMLSKSSDYHFSTVYIDETSNEFDVARKLLAEKKTEGIIFLGGNNRDKKNELSKLTIPCVYSTVSADCINLDNVSSVCVDDRKFAKKAVDYLFDNGHKKIAVVGSEICSLDSMGLRLEGVKDSFKEHGMEFSLNDYIQSLFSFESSYEAFSDVLMKKREYTAVFAMSDIMAIGTAKAVFDYGLKVPDNISVIGFDGIDYSQFYNPTIATFRQPVDKIAKYSIELLLDMILNNKKAQHIVLDCQFIKGNSVKVI